MLVGDFGAVFVAMALGITITVDIGGIICVGSCPTDTIKTPPSPPPPPPPPPPPGLPDLPIVFDVSVLQATATGAPASDISAPGAPDPALRSLEIGVTWYASAVLMDAGFSLLEVTPAAAAGAWMAGGGGAASAIGVGLVGGGGVLIGGGMIIVGLENIVHSVTGETPISDAIGVDIPVFTPSP
jgi:hypothetical protein